MRKALLALAVAVPVLFVTSPALASAPPDGNNCGGRFVNLS